MIQTDINIGGFHPDINMILTFERGKEKPLMSFLMLSGMHI